MTKRSTQKLRKNLRQNSTKKMKSVPVRTIKSAPKSGSVSQNKIKRVIKSVLAKAKKK